MRKIISGAAKNNGALFVDVFNSVPHDFEHMTDHVHLTDRGRDILAKTVVKELVADERFRRIAENVRLKKSGNE